METLVRLMDACEITNTICQLQEGSLLGAVKLENILPWERDCDIAVLSSQFNNLTNYLEKHPIKKLKISKIFNSSINKKRFEIKEYLTRLVFSTIC